MKFVVSSSALLKQLSAINGVVATNPIVPILENFLFQLDRNTLTVTASDLQTVMMTDIEVESADKGAIAIPAKLLLDTLRGLPEQPITLKIDGETFGTEIISENGRYKLSGENPIDFPKVPSVNKSLSMELPADVLGRAIANTIFAASADDLRPAMTGMYVQLSGDSATLGASASRRRVHRDPANSRLQSPQHVAAQRSGLRYGGANLGLGMLGACMDALCRRSASLAP